MGWRTARIALVDDARTSQSPYVDDALLPTPGSSFSSGVQRHLERHIEQPYDLRLLAEHFHVSTRTLLRRYRAGDDSREVRRGILITMNGLATALRNSG